jgi:hypothetical protein
MCSVVDALDPRRIHNDLSTGAKTLVSAPRCPSDCADIAQPAALYSPNATEIPFGKMAHDPSFDSPDGDIPVICA